MASWTWRGRAGEGNHNTHTKKQGKDYEGKKPPLIGVFAMKDRERRAQMAESRQRKKKH